MSEPQPETKRTHEGVPLLYGYLNPHDQGVSLRVWCRWCCIWHTHGAAGKGPGHIIDLAAHCHAPDSPYKDTGYRIEIAVTPFSVVKGQVKVAPVTQDRLIRAGRITETVQRLRDQEGPRQ